MSSISTAHWGRNHKKKSSLHGLVLSRCSRFQVVRKLTYPTPPPHPLLSKGWQCLRKSASLAQAFWSFLINEQVEMACLEHASWKTKEPQQELFEEADHSSLNNVTLFPTKPQRGGDTDEKLLSDTLLHENTTSRRFWMRNHPELVSCILQHCSATPQTATSKMIIHLNEPLSDTAPRILLTAEMV